VTPIIYGNTTSAGTLTLASTTHATKGKILFGTSAYDEVNNRLGIGTTSPSQKLQVSSGSINFTQVTAPTALTATDVTGGGSLSTGNYKYEVTYVNESGETTAGTATGN